MTLRRRRSKYGNRRVRLPGEARAFDSQREADEWVKLKILESRGMISELRRQVSFPLLVNGDKVTSYVADFLWWEGATANSERPLRRVVADAKGYRTPEYKIKKALMKAIHGIEIREL